MNVPEVLWGEVVSHAIYVLNRVTTKALGDSTPYESWTGRKPNIEHLSVFRCLAHMRSMGVTTQVCSVTFPRYR